MNTHFSHSPLRPLVDLCVDELFDVVGGHLAVAAVHVGLLAENQHHGRRRVHSELRGAPRRECRVGRAEGETCGAQTTKL